MAGNRKQSERLPVQAARLLRCDLNGLLGL